MEYVVTSEIDAILSDYGTGSTVMEALQNYMKDDSNIQDLGIDEVPGESYGLYVYEMIGPNHEDWDQEHADSHDYEWYTGKQVATIQITFEEGL